MTNRPVVVVVVVVLSVSSNRPSVAVSNESKSNVFNRNDVLSFYSSNDNPLDTLVPGIQGSGGRFRVLIRQLFLL